ncbi:hypothetical protein N665_3382s0001 [Sinapis alba]|nr:hypothetical protein N665_3382s0001 [Sinapis alba]
MGQAGLGCKGKASLDHESGHLNGQVKRSLRRANQRSVFPWFESTNEAPFSLLQSGSITQIAKKTSSS